MSAWGDSWGVAWGDSFGASDGSPPVVPPVVAERPAGGIYWAPRQRRKTRREVHEERVRLGILPAEPLPKPIVKAAGKVAEKAQTVQAFEAEKTKYAEIFMAELRVTKWLPDYSRAISIALALREREIKRLERERDDEEILLLM